ncbi:hypothetical protein KI387_007941, partial [Taxus chinensis]
MGRTSRWLRSFLGGKKESKQNVTAPPPPPPPPPPPSKDTAGDESKKAPKEKRRWSFRRSVKDPTAEPTMAIVEPRPSYILETDSEQSKHAIAVAAATAAAADAAVAAAQAAAAVVRLTSSGCNLAYGVAAREQWAATTIQTTFRGYLARRALCALKSLVKLQALVRGHIVRKQAAETLRSMQALVRVQAVLRARRVRMSEEGQAVQRQLLQRRQQESHPRRSNDGWNGSTYSMEKQEAKVQSRHAAAMKRDRALAYAFSQQEMERRLDESAKIVEVDTCRPKSSSNRKRSLISESESLEENISSTTNSALYPLYHSTAQSAQPTYSPPQIEGQHASPILVFPTQSACVTGATFHDFSPRTLSGQYGYCEDSTFSTADSSPQYFSAASKAEVKRGPFTPTKSEYAESFFQEYSAFPNYMANTESSKAKVRSHSAPKQRPESSEKMSLIAKKRSSLPKSAENRLNVLGARMQRSSSHVGVASKGFLHSGSMVLDRSTMSLRDSECDTVSVNNGDYKRALMTIENGEHQKR